MLAGLCLWSGAASAYTAAGDRIFPATLLLPQIAPSDDAYFTTAWLPSKSDAVPSASDGVTDISLTYDKTITERLGIGFTADYESVSKAEGGTVTGWQNLATFAQYLLVLDQSQELEMSVGFEHEWGGTGGQGIGADRTGATNFALYTGKGLGDAAWPWLRPIALSGIIAYQAADSAALPDQLVISGAVEYSFPYMESKVAEVALPDWARRLTPLVEFQVSTPVANSNGAQTSALVNPGVSYAGEGWEFAVEAQLPATRAAGSGVGVIAQLHVALDFNFPGSIGRPLFSGTL